VGLVGNQVSGAEGALVDKLVDVFGLEERVVLEVPVENR